MFEAVIKIAGFRRVLGPAALIGACLSGLLAGLGLFTFGYAEGASYLSSDPRACVNCHVMNDAFDSWVNSSHRAAATCNDCHAPHSFLGKWLSKADNGLFHSIAFTTGSYPKPLQIKQRNIQITQNACVSCHNPTVHNMLPEDPEGEVPACVHCHARVGHAHRARRGLNANR